MEWFSPSSFQCCLLMKSSFLFVQSWRWISLDWPMRGKKHVHQWRISHWSRTFDEDWEEHRRSISKISSRWNRRENVPDDDLLSSSLLFRDDQKQRILAKIWKRIDTNSITTQTKKWCSSIKRIFFWKETKREEIQSSRNSLMIKLKCFVKVFIGSDSFHWSRKISSINSMITCSTCQGIVFNFE